MKVLITGAAGLVGSATSAVCNSAGDDVVSLTRSDLDITNEDRVRQVVGDENPDVLINCAAFTDVDGCETNIETCYEVNEKAVGYLASASQAVDCTFLTISTDYVFDGKKSGFYSESDEPSPISVYGKAKLAGERLALSKNPKSIVVRSGWIYGEAGTNFLCLMHRYLREGKTIKAISDSTGTPTFAFDLAQRMRNLTLIRNPGVFHAAKSGPGASYYAFATRIAELLGVDQGLVLAVGALDLDRPAPRPVNSRLDSERLDEVGLDPMPDWIDALERFLK